LVHQVGGLGRVSDRTEDLAEEWFVLANRDMIRARRSEPIKGAYLGAYRQSNLNSRETNTTACRLNQYSL
jgi:hypothetical protein